MEFIRLRLNRSRELRAFALAEIQKAPVTAKIIKDRYNTQRGRKFDATSAAASAALQALCSDGYGRVQRTGHGVYASATTSQPVLDRIMTGRVTRQHFILSQMIETQMFGRTGGRVIRADTLPSLLAATGYKLSYQSVMKHLRRLKKEGLVRSPRYGWIQLCAALQDQIAGRTAQPEPQRADA